MAQNVTLQMVYRKLNSLEEKVGKLEKKLIPEVNLSKKEIVELDKIRQEIKNGETISEKELFSILSK